MLPRIIYLQNIDAAYGLMASVGLALAYAAGCFNTGYYLLKWKTGRDLRHIGSGNAGATNAGRALGAWAFGTTLLGDMSKGALVAYGAQWAGLSAHWQVAAIIAAAVGHNWPAQLAFRGGKGVAVSCGALLWFDPRLAFMLLVSCVALLALTRRKTISAMFAYAVAPVAAAFLAYDTTAIILLAALTGLLIFPHREDLLAELTSLRRGASPVRFKLASEPWEFDAIHRLNYRTFVEEIPQHPTNPERRLIDRFHPENHYIVALHRDRLVGMLALRSRRPFSLDAKVPNLDHHLPAGRRVVEARLLAVEPAFRRTVVFTGLFRYAARHCLQAGFDLAVISATTRQLALYDHLGFTSFGPRVGTQHAAYQPMFLTLEAFDRIAAQSRALRGVDCKRRPRPPLNLLPGPVLTTPEVDAAMAAPAISHRSFAFRQQLGAVRRQLCHLTNARQVQILPGSGSLANAVIAGQLALNGGAGLIVSNGEFGERLVAEARRAQLQFKTLTLPWGTVVELPAVEKLVAQIPRGGWLWFVHHETSTGTLNPFDDLARLATRQGLRLCVDCISSLGAHPVNLRGVHLAAGTSGKGLGAYPGLALVFHDHTPEPAPTLLPSYIDLGHWVAHESVPHTHSSNLVNALSTALRAVNPSRMHRIAENGAWLRARLRQDGWNLIAAEPTASPALVAVSTPSMFSSLDLGVQLEAQGYLVHFQSQHLRARNWFQISLLGDPPRNALRSMLHALHIARHRLTRDAPPARSPQEQKPASPELVCA